MKGRVIKDFTASEKLAMLSPCAERFFVRLLLRRDSYGNIYAPPHFLLRELFPVHTRLRLTDISSWIAECMKAGLLADYQCEGKNYLHVIDGEDELRWMDNKYPLAPGQQFSENHVKKKKGAKKKEVEEEAEVVVVVENSDDAKQPPRQQLFEYSIKNLNELLPTIKNDWQREFERLAPGDKKSRMALQTKTDAKIFAVIDEFITYNMARNRAPSVELFKLWCLRKKQGRN